MPPIRVLQILMDINRGSGIANVVLNWHRNIDKSKIQFDYLICFNAPKEQSFEQEIKKLGGNIFLLPYKGIFHSFSFLFSAYNFFKHNSYHTIHSHITQLNFFYFPLARWFGTKRIIQHAHGTKWSDKILNGWRNYLMLHAVWSLIDVKLACSLAAGKFWYGKDFSVVNNGIDTEKFTYNPTVRAVKRKELGLENNFVVGNIGRFALQKNHTFLLDIFAQLITEDSTARLVLVGGGPLEDDIQAKVVRLGLQDKVLFLGVRKDVAELYQAFDALCMPSLYEGLPVVGIEAQATGLPCVFADTITTEVLLLPQSKMLSLNENAEKWAQAILSLKSVKRYWGKEFLQKKGFDIKDISKKMQEFYEELDY